MAFLKKLLGAATKATEVAAPIVAGAFGGPAAAAGVKAGIGMIDRPKKMGVFTPSSAHSIDDARSQDRARMKSKYGVPISGPGGTDV